MKKYMHTALLLASIFGVLGFFFGCDMPEAAPDLDVPACDTLRTVFLVSRCDDGNARCDLKSTAAPGSVATGCMITIVPMPGEVYQVECVASCN